MSVFPCFSIDITYPSLNSSGRSPVCNDSLNKIAIVLAIFFAASLRSVEQGALKTYSTQPTIKERGRKRTCGPQCKVCLTPRARSLPRDLLAGHRLRCRSAFDSMSLPQAGETSTAYIVRLIGRSTSLVFGIISLDFLAVQVSVQFCVRSSSSCSSSWWLIVVRLACRQFSGSGEALGGSDGLCVLSAVTMLHESHPPRWMQLDAKSVGPL